MKTFPRCFGRVGVVVVVWALAGCGGDSAGPIAPQSLAVTGGNQQTGCFSDTLADSLEVTLTGSDNKPFAGAPVAWQVPSGAATVSRGLDTTDAAGQSRVQLSLGIALTPVTVTATVTGLPPATFSAALAVTPYTLGQTVTGALTLSDCGGGLFPFFDAYVLTLPSSQSFTASLTAATFDALLVLGDTGFPVAFNFDSGDGSGGTGSFLRMIAAGGVYAVVAQSSNAGETGAYTLATTAMPVAVDNCLLDLWVTRGIATDQEIKTTDCVDTSGPFYYDAYQIFLAAGQTMTITESSTAFDAELFLFVGNTLVASDDNGGGGTNARVTHQAPLGQNQVLFIVPATKGVGVTGAYTLTIAPPTATTTMSAWMPLQRTDRPSDARGVPRSTMDLLRSWHRMGQ